MIEIPSFDAVDELARLSAGGDQIKEPARIKDMARQFQYSLRELIAFPEIVKEPGFDLVLAQCRLDRLDFIESGGCDAGFGGLHGFFGCSGRMRFRAIYRC